MSSDQVEFDAIADDQPRDGAAPVEALRAAEPQLLDADGQASDSWTMFYQLQNSATTGAIRIGGGSTMKARTTAAIVNGNVMNSASDRVWTKHSCGHRPSR